MPRKTGNRQYIKQQVSNLVDLLNHQPSLTMTGPIDELADHLVDETGVVIHEALTNVAKHATATATDITIDAESSQLVVTVTDNGNGLPANPPNRHSGFGINNLAARAGNLGGRSTIRSNSAGGVTVTWTVPIVDQPST